MWKTFITNFSNLFAQPFELVEKLSTSTICTILWTWKTLQKSCWMGHITKAKPLAFAVFFHLHLHHYPGDEGSVKRQNHPFKWYCAVLRDFHSSSVNCSFMLVVPCFHIKAFKGIRDLVYLVGIVVLRHINLPLTHAIVTKTLKICRRTCHLIWRRTKYIL